MSISTLISKLKMNGYKVNYSEIPDSDMSVSVYKAEKEKIFSKKLLVFTVDSFDYKYENKLINIIKENNKKNNLCIALCNMESTPDSTKTMYMDDTEDGVCIIHFVYFYNINESYTYNLDFSYSQSKIIKNAILELVKNEEF